MTLADPETRPSSALHKRIGYQLGRVKYRIHNLRGLSKDLADFVTFSAALWDFERCFFHAGL